MSVQNRDITFKIIQFVKNVMLIVYHAKGLKKINVNLALRAKYCILKNVYGPLKILVKECA